MPENEIVVRLPYRECTNCIGAKILLESESSGGGILRPDLLGIWIMCVMVTDDLYRLTARCEGESAMNPGTVLVYTTTAVDAYCSKQNVTSSD